MISEGNQTKFLLDILNNKKNGYYVEMGAFHSEDGSNTVELEREYDWNGVSFEIVEDFYKEFTLNRKNPCILGDATKFNYLEYFNNNDFPKQIDFLQVDIDNGYNEFGRPLSDPYQGLHGLIALPLNLYRFTFITFEHDQCIDMKAESIKNAQREILYGYGYNLIRRTMCEDWWIDPTVIPYTEYRSKIKVFTL